MAGAYEAGAEAGRRQGQEGPRREDPEAPRRSCRGQQQARITQAQHFRTPLICLLLQALPMLLFSEGKVLVE